MRETDINIWKRKIDWIARCGGMALLNTHPDYMNFEGKNIPFDEYPGNYYQEFLNYIMNKYDRNYWQVLPRELVHFWKSY